MIQLVHVIVPSRDLGFSKEARMTGGCITSHLNLSKPSKQQDEPRILKHLKKHVWLHLLFQEGTSLFLVSYTVPPCHLATFRPCSRDGFPLEVQNPVFVVARITFDFKRYSDPSFFAHCIMLLVLVFMIQHREGKSRNIYNFPPYFRGHLMQHGVTALLCASDSLLRLKNYLALYLFRGPYRNIEGIQWQKYNLICIFIF